MGPVDRWVYSGPGGTSVGDFSINKLPVGTTVITY
jgi:hypothetical protein